MSKKSPAQLDREIAQGRETLLYKRVRTAIRGLDARDRAEIQSRIEKIVRDINAAGGNKLGIQGDLRREESLEVWDLVTFVQPILGVSIETGEVELR
jgi:hypothetical protein